MPSYSYLVIDSKGKESKGSIDAEHQELAENMLKDSGFTILSIKEAGALEKDIRIGGSKKVKSKPLSVFCRQFVSMLEAGVTIVDALGMLEEQTANKRLAQAVHETKQSVQQGHTLSESMAAQGDDVFPPMLVNMVSAGEVSGKVEKSMERMAIQLETSTKLSGMIRKALMYPIVLGIVMVVIILVMVIKVIPSYAEMFASMGTELPGITQAFMDLSTFIKHNWLFIIISIVLLVVGIRLYKKTDSGKDFFGRLATKLPLFGALNVKTYASVFARTLSTLLYSGVTLIDGLDSVAKIMKNSIYRKHVMEAKEEVAKGVLLSEPLKSGGLFPPMLVHMVTIGEETGDMEKMLDNVADYYDEEVEATTGTVMAALEPMIIVVMAVVVIMLVAAIMAPMLKMYDTVGTM